MNPEAPRGVRGEDLRGADALMRSYFRARQDAGMDLSKDAREFADMSGMADGFTEVSQAIAEDRAMETLRMAGAPLNDEDALVDTAVILNTGDLFVLLTAGYMHGMQIGALAGVGIVHPDTEEH